uniref:SEFIR domain-containing protein n=1 Tax=Desulfovibrio sp. U5L TaxID=596152 RepID=I2Q6G2_9BACT
MDAPKLFISYSWSTPDHEQWVLDLATELCDSGVDVILDKWNLREGQDAIVFMEQMVTDPDIKKVAMIFDRAYADKADGRLGGVGTETQIISKEVYEKQSQDKFVAIVCEKDETGKPFLPAYYRSRIFIDLAEEEKYTNNFEKLLRWIHDKPLYVKPQIGSTPSFLKDGESISLGTTPAFKRCVDAFKNNKPSSQGALTEYFTTFVANLERFRIQSSDEEFDELFLKNIQEFLPYRNEFIQMLITVAQYSPSTDSTIAVHRFFENITPYFFKTKMMNRYSDWDFDNFKFIIHELFLYALAVFLKHDRFDMANYLLKQGYYISDRAISGRESMVGYDIFRQYLSVLEYKNSKLETKRYSLHADLLKERCVEHGISFHHLMQADFIAFICSTLEEESIFRGWWPETLLYIDIVDFTGTFEIFARSRSKSYFDQVKILFAVNSPSELTPLLESYRMGKRSLPKWGFHSFSPEALMGFKALATRP